MAFHADTFQSEEDEQYLSQTPIDLRIPKSQLEDIGRCDALGNERGHTYLREFEQAVSLVLEQRLRAFGKRPQDYVARELLLNSTMNDRRNWMFSAVRKHNPNWLYIGISKKKCLRTDIKLIKQCRVFDYLHRMHTLQILRDSDGEYASILDRVARCATSFFQINTRPFSRTMGIRGSNAAEACHQTSICPHCFARQAANTFCSLKTKAAIRSKKGLFVLISVKQDFDPLEKAVVINWKHNAKSKLVRLAKTMGATGGIWSFQMTPTKDCVVRWNFGEVIASGESLGARFAVLAHIPAQRDSLMAWNDFKNNCGTLDSQNGIEPNICFRKASGEYDLRRMITGCWPMNQEQYGGYVGPGLFYWPSVWLCSQSQWKNRFDLLKQGRAFQCWGNWLGKGDKTRKNGIGLMPSTDLSNVQKSIEMRERRDSIFPVVKSVVDAYVSSTGKFPGRRILGELLCSHKMNVSERDIRWFCDEMKR